MRTTYVLSHTEAMQMVSAVRTQIDAKQLGAAVAVVDAHGELLAFMRSDTCRLPCIAIAINKAYTAARQGTESKALGDEAKERGFPLTNFGELRFVTWGGGVPIVHSGQVIGAVGVSGLSEDEDVELAKLAVSLIPA